MVFWNTIVEEMTRGNFSFAILIVGADNKDGFKDKLTEIISSYFSIGDSYTYDLTRVKEGFGTDTISIDDFVEWNEDSVCDLVDYILQRLFK